jgi:uncharacterized protein
VAMRCGLAILVLWLLPAVGAAQCVGTDLLQAMPAETRAALDAKARAEPFAEGILWQATRDGQTVEIIGTYHLPDPRHAPALAHAEAALGRSGALLLEARPEDLAGVAAQVAARPELLFIVDGPTLPDLLTPEEWQSVSQAAARQGLPGFMVAKMRPWYLSTVLSIPACVKAGQGKMGGLDMILAERAADRALTVLALEDPATALEIFTDLTPEQELSMMRAWLASLTAPEDIFATMVNAYFREEIRLIWEFMVAESLSVPGSDKAQTQLFLDLFEDRLMTRRNMAWIPVIEATAAEYGTVTVAFGALHLPGQSGVLQLLADRGWQIARSAP